MTVELSLEDLRQTAAGSPGGDFLRGTWLPFAARTELTDTDPILPVRLLGEGLVAFRTTGGELALMQERCPHNGYSLVGSSVEDKSLVCWKHGWHFGTDGACWVEGYQGKTWPVQWANANLVSREGVGRAAVVISRSGPAGLFSACYPSRSRGD